MDECKLGEKVNANNDKEVVRIGDFNGSRLYRLDLARACIVIIRCALGLARI